MHDIGYAFAVVFLGYFVLGVTGFGSSLVVVPLLSWRWPLPQVVMLALMLDLPASAMLGGLNFRDVDKGEFAMLLPGMAVGSAFGLWLRGSVDPRWPVLVLGIYIAIVGARALLAAHAVQQQAPARWRGPAGVAAGLIEVMFATAGPVVLAWLTRRVTDIRSVRATTPATMTVCAATALAVIAFDGGLTDPAAWQRWAVMLAVAVAGVVIGNRVARHVPVGMLRRVVNAMLVTSGLALVMRAM
ncbi:MAG TPA: sulfite exporter TauE/SafE family protein [Ramlibacter sp.]|uniref:sulfite exporter TauE/SafE family protein n=1 Tax=Ramlibacter sp. TaxID=1917967 RepID=UPI002C2FA106|nr:sulfite exporter TauE/SafE family protein [Ramlibacter sp.]HVZ46892.1 sulfite exporter TauE/SafE family protein [Ramlibacter sp.]